MKDSVTVRERCEFQDFSNDFITSKTFSYDRQYCFVYGTRLRLIKSKLVEAAKTLVIGGDVSVIALADVKEGEECVVTGTLFKLQVLKPSILKEIGGELNVLPQPISRKLLDESDSLVLEDELQRVTLAGDIDLNEFVSGVPVALKGVQKSDGKFYVNAVAFAASKPPPPLPVVTEDRYILFMSGLEFDGKGTESGGELLMWTELLVDWLAGRNADGEDEDEEQLSTELEMVKRIARVVIAGNLVSAASQDSSTLVKSKYTSKNAVIGGMEAIEAADHFLNALAPLVDVDLMPGANDPSNYFLPQQPFHRCLLKSTAANASLKSVTNPYHAAVDSVRLLGTSGQNVEDVSRVSGKDEPVDILESLAKWSHLSPSAPDTLGCYPYYDVDPFVISELPNILFAGNQDKLQHRKLHDVGDLLLLSIPSFKRTGTVALVNLRNLDVLPISFKFNFDA